MFEDSLIESGHKLKSKRGWTTTLSFTAQLIFLGLLVLYPLIVMEALPRQQLMTFLVAPPPPPPPPPPPAAAPVKIVKVVQTDIVDGQLRQPTKIPQKINKIVEDEAPPPVTSAAAGVVGGVPGGVPGGQMGGVIGGIIGSTPVAVPKIATPQKVRVSQGVLQGNLIRDVKPTYPAIAKAARVQGSVVLQATISKDGSIENLRVVSGHPMLVQAALEAVKQWRYRPYALNGEPVEVDTQITVNFTLSGS